VAINASAVNQRSGPGTGFAVMATHPFGQTLTFAGYDGNWAKVVSDAGEGYILGSLLSFKFGNVNGSLSPGFLEQQLTGFRVVIDAGHGGRDPGAIGVNGLFEKTVNLTLARKLAHLLRQTGAEVVMTRETDVYMTLDERMATINGSGADLVVSIHNNAHPSRAVSGTQTFYGVVPGSFDLGSGVHRNLVALGLTDRGVLSASFRVLRMSTIPAILTETAFLSNWDDSSLLATESFLDQAAQAHFLGIGNWLLRKK
jgi:N-acetylmuramoyl-L-alanine amidase